MSLVPWASGYEAAIWGASLHIAFQKSGGRGEYEVVGSHSGYSAIQLEGWTFNLSWPDGIVRETGLGLEPATSGKPRLRSLLDTPFQIGRMIASMLLLPDPRRAYRDTLVTTPVAVEKGYVLSRVGFGPDTEFTGFNDLVTIDPSFVDLENLSFKESIGVAFRWSRIAAIYQRVDQFSASISSLISAHQTYMSSGNTVDQQLTKIVRELSKAVEFADSSHSAAHDVLPALERMAGISAPSGPGLPPPDQLGEEEVEIRARSAHDHRLVKSRGATGRRFSLSVREAYGHRCAFCGARLGGVRSVLPGIDAAHILAWHSYDLDVVPNGIALCKLHHWAFDAALMLPIHKNGIYLVRFTTLTEQFDIESLHRLGEDGFVLPAFWLPSDPAQRPSPRYLDILQADLAASFIS